MAEVANTLAGSPSAIREVAKTENASRRRPRLILKRMRRSLGKTSRLPRARARRRTATRSTRRRRARLRRSRRGRALPAVPGLPRGRAPGLPWARRRARGALGVRGVRGGAAGGDPTARTRRLRGGGGGGGGGGSGRVGGGCGRRRRRRGRPLRGPGRGGAHCPRSGRLATTTWRRPSWWTSSKGAPPRVPPPRRRRRRRRTRASAARARALGAKRSAREAFLDESADAARVRKASRGETRQFGAAVAGAGARGGCGGGAMRRRSGRVPRDRGAGALLLRRGCQAACDGLQPTNVFGPDQAFEFHGGKGSAGRRGKRPSRRGGFPSVDHRRRCVANAEPGEDRRGADAEGRRRGFGNWLERG